MTVVVAIDGGDEGLPTITSRRMEMAAPTADGPPDALASAVIETGLPPSSNVVVGVLDEISGAMSTVGLIPIPR
ncbi:MAG: hypothetical protein DRJ65_17860 [Acidobacteria bacterium]|nr:MAG: hypothetical protein DRJ65_17860 [Acidobacteriota bacterium]